jgi:tetratricopeptide (TPR) repeat protein
MELAKEIVDAEPELPHGYIWLGWYHVDLGIRGISPRENIKKALEFAQKALSLDLDESVAGIQGLMCIIYLSMRKYEKAIASGKRALELNPNGAQIHFYLSRPLFYTDRPDEAIAHIKQAIRLDPIPPYYYYSNLARCYRLKGQYENALTEYKKALQLAPDSWILHASLAANYILLGREEEARASAAKALELNPNLSVTLLSKITRRYKNQDHVKLLLDAYRKAGVPE